MHAARGYGGDLRVSGNRRAELMRYQPNVLSGIILVDRA
jgi:hypothetical protein